MMDYDGPKGEMNPLTDNAHRFWFWFLCLVLTPIAWSFSFYLVASGLDILT